ncbi:MAG TPA: SDR family NAD(P)-dependent oxidoreductase [Enhygromyxa sp.]|nr:SDR family NAD(P)-dependent oxidoreductase [Enhygromyxa sp.]
MSSTFEGRVVVVTGGTGALGSAVTEVLVDAGAIVHIPVFETRTPDHFAHAEHERVHLQHGVDLGDEAQVVDYYASVARSSGGLWASIHLAGGFAMASLLDTSLAELERLWRMNLASCFLCCREAVRAIRSTGEGGRLVNVAARPALIPTAGMIAYATSKAGVAAMTSALAEELAPEGIWVNAIAPSIIDTPANRAAMPNADHSRWPSTAALATEIRALASPDNQCVRGAVVPVFGRS